MFAHLCVCFFFSQNKAAVVTSQWRAKVFELMVQCKSQEITSKEEESKHKLTVKSLTSKLEGTAVLYWTLALVMMTSLFEKSLMLSYVFFRFSVFYNYSIIGG